MFDRELYTEIDIEAPPSAVWAVLSELGQWSEWNRVVLGLDLRGPLREGTKGTLSLHVGGPLGTQKLTVVLDTVRENQELAWRGGPALIMSGCHRFRIEPRGEGSRLIHTEVFSGPLAPPLIGLMRSQLTRSYAKLNEGLKRRCEQGLPIRSTAS